MTKDTAYLITNMLIDTAKTGTAKRLKINNYEVASKTGTVGNSKSNTDAFNISYTSNHTIISYIGETKMPTSINGATFPTLITKDILNILYENKSPKNFDKPDTVVVQNLDADEYQKNTISVTDKTENTIQEIFSKSNLPQATNSTLNLKLDVFNFEHKKPILSFFASPKYSYEIIRTHKNKEETISSLTNINDMQILHFEDKSAKNGEIYEYYIKIYEKSSNNIFKTNKLKLKSF